VREAFRPGRLVVDLVYMNGYISIAGMNSLNKGYLVWIAVDYPLVMDSNVLTSV
jgi:hypothetical protein